jgi:hypothetical protein
MESIFVELARSLAAQGPAYTMLAITAAALAYVTNRWIKAETKCLELSSTLNEKRLTERSETISVLHAGVQANQKLAESISVRTETLNNLIVVVTAGTDRLERALADIFRRLEELRRVAGAD